MIKPRRFVNYNKYTLFMSFLAHEFKRLGIEKFIEEFSNKKYRGIYKKYLDSYIEYINNKRLGITEECEVYPRILVVEPYVYKTYFKFKDREILNKALKKAVPEFLKRGILITEIQEAVNAPYMIK